MKNIFKSYWIVSAFLILSCNVNNKTKKEDINTQHLLTTSDSLEIEEDLFNYKNVLFSHLHQESKKETYAKKNMQILDTLPDMTYFYYNNWNLMWVPDKNKEKLIQKWLDKKEFFLEKDFHLEIPSGSLDLARALAFYNSEDLEKFLDSIRKTEYQRITVLKLDSINEVKKLKE